MKRFSCFLIVGILILSFFSCEYSSDRFATSEPSYNTKVILTQSDSSISISQQDWAKIQSVLESRLKSLNIQKYKLNFDSNQNNIMLSINIDSSSANQSESDLLDILCKKGKLEFCDPDNNVVLDNNDIKSGYIDKTQGQVIVVVNFTNAGSIKLEAISKKHLNEKINIYMDGILLTNPLIIQPITDGQAILSKIQNVSDFNVAASIINSGPLPYKLKAQICE